MSDDDLIQAVYERTRSFASINILRAAYEVGQAPLQAKDAEIAALKEDAERYRWLRDPKRCEALGKEPYVGIEDDDEHPNHWALIGEKADAAIDSARAAGDGEETS